MYRRGGVAFCFANLVGTDVPGGPLYKKMMLLHRTGRRGRRPLRVCTNIAATS